MHSVSSSEKPKPRVVQQKSPAVILPEQLQTHHIMPDMGLLIHDELGYVLAGTAVAVTSAGLTSRHCMHDAVHV